MIYNFIFLGDLYESKKREKGSQGDGKEK